MQVDLTAIEAQLNAIKQAIDSGDFDSALELIQKLQQFLECFFSSTEMIPITIYPQLADIEKEFIFLSNTILEKKAETKLQLKKIIKNKKQVGLYNQIK